MGIIYVAMGGTAGALARYGLSLWFGSKWNHSFPLGTFVINITGSFLLGLLNVFVLERTVLSPGWRLGLGVGFLGAYTTFSTFTYEAMVLLEEGSYLTALGYVGLSAVLGLLAAYLGMYLARAL